MYYLKLAGTVLAQSLLPIEFDAERGGYFVQDLNTVYSGPALVVEKTPEYRKELTPMEFISSFTVPEENGIRASTDRIVKGFLRRVDHPALKLVDLNSEQNQQGVMYLASLGLITEARAGEILQGIAEG